VILGAARDQCRAFQVPADAAQVGVHLGAEVRVFQERFPLFCREHEMEVDLSKGLGHGVISIHNYDTVCLWNPFRVPMKNRRAFSQGGASLTLGFVREPLRGSYRRTVVRSFFFLWLQADTVTHGSGDSHLAVRFVTSC